MQRRSNQNTFFRKSLFLLVILMCLQSMPGSVQAEDQSRLSTHLSTTRFSVDQTAVLSITVDGSRSAQVTLPEQDNLIFHRRGQSSKMQVINGSFSSSVTITYVIEALKEGQYRIPPLSIHVDDDVLKTKPLSFEVISAAAVNQSQGVGSGNTSDKKVSPLAFMTIEGLPTEGYRGQILPFTIKAYFREGIQAQIDKLPQIVGASFVLSPLEKEPAQTKESHNGKNYLVVTWQASTSAIKEGRHSFQISLEASLLIPKRNSRSQFGRDPFFDDDFFSGFFDSVEKKNVNLKSPTQSLTINTLPRKGRPADFNGAIGRFTLKTQATPTKIEEGEPITLTMTVSGTGNFDRVTTPEFPAEQDWKTYSPVSRFENQNTSYQGKKIFEQAIVPTTSTVKSIPALSFSYFDPEQHTYITTSTDPIPVTVTAQATATNNSGQTVGQSAAPEPPAQTPQQSVPPVQQHLTTQKFTTAIVPVYKHIWFIVIAALCTCILAGVALVALKRRYLAKNQIVLQQKHIKQHVRSKFAELKEAMDSSQTETFLYICREIIQYHLAHLWQIEPSAITLYDLQNRCENNSPLIEIFTIAQQHAYGGKNLTIDEMQQFYTTLKTALEEMA